MGPRAQGREVREPGTAICKPTLQGEVQAGKGDEVGTFGAGGSQKPQPQAGALRPQRGLSPTPNSQGSRSPRDTGDLRESPFCGAGPGVLATPNPQAVLHPRALLCPPVGVGSPSVPPPPSAAAVHAWKGGEGTPSGQHPKLRRGLPARTHSAHPGAALPPSLGTQLRQLSVGWTEGSAWQPPEAGQLGPPFSQA